MALNVWTPEPALAQSAAARRPIVFYVHGGAGKLGSCHDDALSGHELARHHGLVVVSSNYRLGAFGFLAHPALSTVDQTRATAVGRDAPTPADCLHTNHYTQPGDPRARSLELRRAYRELSCLTQQRLEGLLRSAEENRKPN